MTVLYVDPFGNEVKLPKELPKAYLLPEGMTAKEFLMIDDLVVKNDSAMQAVIDEHIEKHGLKSMHLTLGPEATPEKVREQLEMMAKLDEEYFSYSEVERLKARLAANSELFYKIGKLCTTDVRKFVNGEISEEEQKLKNEIGTLCEFHDSIPMADDIEWMKKERIKYGS